MLAFRFNEVVDKVNIDYIIFLHGNFIEIDALAIFDNMTIPTTYSFPINDSIIGLNQIHNNIISIKCRTYCQKLVSLGIFL